MKIQLLNSISPIIYEELPERYEVGEEVAGPDAILVRSADMHAMEPVSYTHLDVYKRQADIDTALRFKIKNYILNYSLICAHRIGDSVSENWVNYIEYGTTDLSLIHIFPA